MDNQMLFLGLGYLAAGFGAGLCLVAAAFGIARLASAALEGTARQPEAAGDIRTSMIIPAALIEGLGLFALVICLLLALKKGPDYSTWSPTTGSAAASSQAGH